jgi:hypothetical protein
MPHQNLTDSAASSNIHHRASGEEDSHEFMGEERCAQEQHQKRPHEGCPQAPVNHPTLPLAGLTAGGRFRPLHLAPLPVIAADVTASR